MKRAVVIGCPGAGKSTFARKLRDRTGLPLYYLDRLWHRPDRTTVSREEFDARLGELLQGDRWILDGNYQRTLEVRLAACDAVFLLDLPLEDCLAGAEARIGKAREDMPWVETEFDPEFRQWILDFPQRQLPEIYRLLARYRDGRETFVFRSSKEADAYFATLGGNLMIFDTVKQNLEARGYTVRVFSTGKEAADYLDANIDGKSVGFGGSATLDALGLYERLGVHNQAVWHWRQDPGSARKEAMRAEVYLTSVNALAETGELVNIDGAGNRAAATLFGHEKVFFVVGRNKLVPGYDEAVWRARNVAAPQRAKQLKKRTPCTVKGDRCYDCKSPERICRGLVTLWGPMMGMEAEVLLIEEDLGL